MCEKDIESIHLAWISDMLAQLLVLNLFSFMSNTTAGSTPFYPSVCKSALSIISEIRLICL